MHNYISYTMDADKLNQPDMAQYDVKPSIDELGNLTTMIPFDNQRMNCFDIDITRTGYASLLSDKFTLQQSGCENHTTCVKSEVNDVDNNLISFKSELNVDNNYNSSNFLYQHKYGGQEPSVIIEVKQKEGNLVYSDAKKSKFQCAETYSDMLFRTKNAMEVF